MDLAAFERAVSLRLAPWHQAGIAATFHAPNPDHCDRDKWAASVELECDSALGEMILWTSGEADVTAAYLSDGAYWAKCYQLQAETEMASCLETLTELMSIRPDPSTLHLPPSG